MPRLPTIAEEPTGLLYRSAFLQQDQERELLALLEGLDYVEVQMRGQTAKRTVRQYGYRYDFESWQVVPTDPPAAWVLPVRERAAELAEVEAEALAQTLVTRYPPGAPIGWHRDAPAFGAPVVGISIGSACRMRFQRKAAGVRKVHEITLARGSAYVLSGAARSSWQHSIPPVPELRYSITFRTLLGAAGGAPVRTSP